MARSHLDVAASAVCDVAKDNFLGNPAAHADGQAGEQLVFAVGVFVFLRQPHRRAKRWSARNDRHLVERFRVREKLEQQRVAGFVIGGVLSFPFRSCARLRRSLPQRTLSRASSSSASVIAFKPRRAASNAASLITLASSAPE